VISERCEVINPLENRQHSLVVTFSVVWLALVERRAPARSWS
jgi:hypothetical protein